MVESSDGVISGPNPELLEAFRRRLATSMAEEEETEEVFVEDPEGEPIVFAPFGMMLPTAVERQTRGRSPTRTIKGMGKEKGKGKGRGATEVPKAASAPATAKVTAPKLGSIPCGRPS